MVTQIHSSSGSSSSSLHGSWTWQSSCAKKTNSPSDHARENDMPIVVNVDVMLARRKMRLNTLADLIGITPQNLSILKTGKARAIRFSTLERLCEVLHCQPGDLLFFEQSANVSEER